MAVALVKFDPYDTMSFKPEEFEKRKDRKKEEVEAQAETDAWNELIQKQEKLGDEESLWI